MFWFRGLPLLGILGSRRGGAAFPEDLMGRRRKVELVAVYQPLSLLVCRGEEYVLPLQSTSVRPRTLDALFFLILFDLVGLSKLPFLLRPLPFFCCCSCCFFCQTHLLSPYPSPSLRAHSPPGVGRAAKGGVVPPTPFLLSLSGLVPLQQTQIQRQLRDTARETNVKQANQNFFGCCPAVTETQKLTGQTQEIFSTGRNISYFLLLYFSVVNAIISKVSKPY